MPRFLSKRITIWFAGALLVFLLNAAFCFYSILQLERSRDLNRESEEFIYAVESALSLAKDAETGVRGFVITGKENYLEPYHAGLEQLQHDLPALRTHPVTTQRKHTESVDNFERLIREKLADLRSVMELRRSAGFEAAHSLVIQDRGKSLMDAARAEAARLEAAENTYLAEQTARSKRSSRNAYITLGIVTVLNVSLLVSFYRVVREEAGRRQRASDEIRASEKLLRTIIDNSAALISMKDLDGRYVMANKAFLQLTGKSQSEVKGKTVFDLLPAEVADVVSRNDQEIIESGQTRHFEEGINSGVTPDGEARTFVSVRFPLRDSENKPYAICSVSTEITDRKRAEEQLETRKEQLLNFAATLEERVERRTAQLSEANQQLEAFTYTVSHDLRAPLRGVQGFADALAEDYGSHLDETGRDYLRRITGGAQKMEKLIEDLLAYSHLSRSELDLAPTHLGSAIHDALQSIDADVQSHGAEIQVVPPLPAVLAHRTTLLQVLQNLLSNAIKFTKPGEKPRIRVFVEPLGEVTRINVEDNGIGIEKEYFERIFQVFERLHGYEVYPGTGIGLAIVRKGAERRGGRCGVESSVANGSKFWIELSAAPSPQ